jgi:hypothetical protein
MAAHGGKRPNAGRKSNAQRNLEVGFICKAFSKDVQEIKWKQLLDSKDENIVLKAMTYLTNRVFGMPTQPIEGDHQLRVVVDVVRPNRAGNQDK